MIHCFIRDAPCQLAESCRTFLLLTPLSKRQYIGAVAVPPTSSLISVSFGLCSHISHIFHFHCSCSSTDFLTPPFVRFVTANVSLLAGRMVNRGLCRVSVVVRNQNSSGPCWRLRTILAVAFRNCTLLMQAFLMSRTRRGAVNLSGSLGHLFCNHQWVCLL